MKELVVLMSISNPERSARYVIPAANYLGLALITSKFTKRIAAGLSRHRGSDQGMWFTSEIYKCNYFNIGINCR